MPLQRTRERGDPLAQSKVLESLGGTRGSVGTKHRYLVVKAIGELSPLAARWRPRAETGKLAPQILKDLARLVDRLSDRDFAKHVASEIPRELSSLLGAHHPLVFGQVRLVAHQDPARGKVDTQT